MLMIVESENVGTVYAKSNSGGSSLHYRDYFRELLFLYSFTAPSDHDLLRFAESHIRSLIYHVSQDLQTL